MLAGPVRVGRGGAGNTDQVNDPAGLRERNRQGRDETPLQQLDRNWGDLLQELRVAQTGVQLLTGFLMVLPFQPRFADLTQYQLVTYLVTLAAAVIATAFLIAPVSIHRMLFRRRQRRATVQIAHRLAQVGLALLGVAIVGVVLLIFSFVLGATAGIIGAVLAGLLLISLWVLLPIRVLIDDDKDDDDLYGADEPSAREGSNASSSRRPLGRRLANGTARE